MEFGAASEDLAASAMRTRRCRKWCMRAALACDKRPLHF